MNNEKSEIKTNFETQKIKNMINNITNEINKMKLNCITDIFIYEQKIIELFPDFYENHPFLVKKLCKGDNISMLYQMLDRLDTIEEKKDTFENVEKELGNQLAKKYIHTKINI
jgi:hypothetical protein